MVISTQVHSNVSCKKFDNLMDFHGDGIICCGDVDAGISDSEGIIVNDVRQSNCTAEYFQQHPDPRGGRPTNCADKE